MSIANHATYKQRLAAPHQTYKLTRSNTHTARVAKMLSYWTTAGQGVAPSTAAVPTSATIGTFGQRNPVTADLLRIIGIDIVCEPNSAGQNQIGTILIADRLSHQGGLSGTAAGAQTTNLPTAALTRYTSGVGVFAAVEIYTAIGATPTTFTVSYTNQAGTAGRTSIATDIGNANFQEVGLMLPIPLQQGDTGVRSVESLTLAGSTGTVGDFGITLFKPILSLPVQIARMEYDFDALTSAYLQFENIIDNAALWIIYHASGGGSSINSSVITGQIYFSED